MKPFAGGRRIGIPALFFPRNLPERTERTIESAENALVGCFRQALPTLARPRKNETFLRRGALFGLSSAKPFRTRTAP
ncbi:hypothetical protein ACI2LJ_37030 [Streptomyces sp. NPDC088090]|uniref:hypothetical protein n=1 Tax=Streptomyces sp. NPDC088090 TaxID=3365822 RepID=UPI00384D5FE6